MKAKVDQDACISCGLCVEICPAVFEMNTEDKAVVKSEKIPAEAKDACRQAAANCPVEAITITE
ncbi:MAG: ferredoxin [Chitinispirillaceae bacterium]|nr:ferredoxin [Chitinispirillaceae bacterium]